MKSSRRTFAKQLAFGASALSVLPVSAKDTKPNDEALEKAAARPVLKRELFKEPVIIESIELLRKGGEHFIRVRAKGGAEGISVDNGRADVLHAVINRLVAPYFVGKDARDLEEHLFGVYRERDNYKYQGLALW